MRKACVDLIKLAKGVGGISTRELGHTEFHALHRRRKDCHRACSSNMEAANVSAQS
jgi:hypothetical protein